MTNQPIDVWDSGSFDQDLAERLAPFADLAVAYYRRDHEIFLSHDLGRGPGRSILRPSNAYAGAFHAFREGLIDDLQVRTIRAWHYTRLTDSEVEALRRDGPHLSTPETLRQRLGALVEGGQLDSGLVDRLIAASPFQTQRASREGKFWMASHPIAIDDSGVEPLMAHWGGEVASMHTRDPQLLASLAAIGRPRIIELAVPLSATVHAYSAAEAVVATFARDHGAIPEAKAFDLYINAPLDGSAVRAVHSEGEGTFAAMGRSHPRGYVDRAIGRWKELTGDDD